MFIRRFLISIIVLLGAAAPLQAIISVKIVLNDGSEYEGYIETQGSGLDIAFQADKFTLYLPKNQIKDYNGKKVISLESQEDSSMLPVTILEERDSVAKILCQVKRKFTISPSDVKEIVLSEDSRLVTGIDREYTLYSGEIIKGKYIKEIPGQTIFLEDSLNTIRTIKTDEYSILRFIPRFGLGMSEQSMLLDKITTIRGEVYSGFIEEINYQDNANNNFFLYITVNDGSIHQVKLADIKKYQKLPNPQYKPQYINKWPEGTVAVNGGPAHIFPVPEKYDSKLYTILLPKEKTTVISAIGTNVKIEFETNPGERQITKDQFVILRLKQALLRRYKIESESIFAIKADNFIFSKKLNTGKYEFNIEGNFYDPTKSFPYVIFDRVNKIVIPVFIQR